MKNLKLTVALVLLISACSDERPPPMTEGKCTKTPPASITADGPSDEQDCAWRGYAWHCWVTKHKLITGDIWVCERGAALSPEGGP